MTSKYIILTLAIATLALIIHSSVLVTGQDLLFNETFNAVTEAGSYVHFIEKLRTRVRDKKLTSVQGVPMLPSVQECGNKHFHIILIHGGSMITVQIQQVDLYLVAFQGSNGQWYAFQDEGKRAPPNSKLLSWTARYPTDGSVANTKVGRRSLEGAIHGLAKYHRNENKNEKASIQVLMMTLMVMFPEAIRFKRVAEFVNPCMLKLCTGDPKIGTNIKNLIQNWEKISKMMRLSGQSGNFCFKDLNITTVEQAVSTVGILLYQEVPKGPDKKKSKACHRVPNTGSTGSPFYLTQEYHTFDHCMVGDWWKYSKPANSTNTCSAAQD